MTTAAHDPFGARETLSTPLGERTIWRLDALRDVGDIDRLPYSISTMARVVVSYPLMWRKGNKQIDLITVVFFVARAVAPVRV